MKDNIIAINNLSKKYEENDKFKLDDININLPKGSVMGFIGKNGAGKTTTIKLMLNQLKKDDGHIKIFGLDSVDDEIEIKDNIGVVFAENHFHGNFTPKIIENIMKNVYSKWDSTKYYEYLKRFDIQSDKKIKELSHGMKMKVTLSVALSHDPMLLILDEATSGLDPVTRADIADIFYDFIGDGEKTIFFSTHITSDLDRIADYITFIDNGKIILSETKEKLDEDYGIIKCRREDLANIPEELIIGKRETDFSTEILVNDRNLMIDKTPDIVVDKIIIENLMTFMESE